MFVYTRLMATESLGRRERSVRTAPVVSAGLVTILALGGFLAWAVVVSYLVGGDALPLVALGTLAAVVAMAAQRLDRAGGWRMALVAAVGASALLHIPGLGATYPSGAPFGPLRYANASGAFAVIGAAACLLVALRVRGWLARTSLTMAAAGFGAIAILSGSRAAAVGLVLITIGALVGRPRAVRFWLGACGALIVVALATTGWLASEHVDGEVSGRAPSMAAALLTQRRLDLWSEALALHAQHPVTGVGLGRFRLLAPSARGDPDVVAAHNSYLQTAAELGTPGLLLAILVTGGALGALARSRADRGTAVAGGAFVAIALHATVDYVLHAPAVTLLLAAVIAAGATPPAAGE